MRAVALDRPDTGIEIVITFANRGEVREFWEAARNGKAVCSPDGLPIDAGELLRVAFILILFLRSPGDSITMTATEFRGRPACVAAGIAAVHEFEDNTPYTVTAKLVCVSQEGGQ